MLGDKRFDEANSARMIFANRLLAVFFVLLVQFATAIQIQEHAKSTIPLIDLHAWTTNISSPEKEAKRKEVATLVGKACETTGFFAIQNHGVNNTSMNVLWETTKEFFDLPTEQKMELKTTNETEYPYGYEQSETLSIAGKSHGNCTGHDILPPDLKETFSLGPDNGGMLPRKYPQQPKYLKDALITYYREMEQLALSILSVFAIALGLPEDWFVGKMDRHMSALRLLNYFEVDAEASRRTGQLRAGAHTDYGALTILKSGGPGLQVFLKDQWIDVPYLPDTYVINLGDLMQRWTNDRWISTLHRVILPPSDGQKHRRQSIAYFVNINGDTQVETLGSCVDDDNPAKYPPISAKEYLMSKHLASMRVTEPRSDIKDEL